MIKFKKIPQPLKVGDIVIRTKERIDGSSRHGEVGQAMKILHTAVSFSQKYKCHAHRVELLAPRAGQTPTFDLLEDRMKKI